MLLVLEGCDGSGKSVIAEQLGLWWANEIIHCTRETPNTFEFFNDIIRRAETRNIVADRFCYGQFVYQPTEERPLSPLELRDLEEMMYASGAKLLYVYASRDEIKQRLAARGEIVVQGVDAIIDRYENLFFMSDGNDRRTPRTPRILPVIPVYTGAKKEEARWSW